MEKQTKILIGLAIGGAIGYLLFKPKETTTDSTELTTDVIDSQTSEVNVVPDVISTSTTTRTTTKRSIVEKISTALNTNTKPISTKPITTSTTTETTTMCLGELITMPNGTLQCVEAYIITDQERLQNSFVPKEFRNELSRDTLGLDSFMTASDIYFIGNWAGGGSSNSGMRGGPSDYFYSPTGTIST